jgi:CheY-like chemotaxis protein
VKSFSLLTGWKYGRNLVMHRQDAYAQSHILPRAGIPDQTKEAAVILVIDDEPTITELLTDILEYHGHPVIVAHDAQSAMDILSLHRPEAMLVDLMMPSVDGLSLAVALRHDPDMRNVPLIAMSASDSALALADRMGDFDAYISKPFDNDSVVSVVEQFAGMAPSSRS